MSTDEEKSGSSDFFSSMIWTTNESFVAKTEREIPYILKPYPNLDGMSLVDMHKEMGKDDILKNSGIYKDISTFLYETSSSFDGGDKGGKTVNGDSGGFSINIGDVTAIRIVTLVALFFMVHVLVRLHQYSLRLAAFWDARADAVLLARSFACRSAETFDDLVAALAPDAYDFKPPPKSGHEAMMNLMGQLLRRDSRKS